MFYVSCWETGSFAGSIRVVARTIGNSIVSASKHHIDWRWEFMVKAIDAVLLVWDDLVANFDLEKMLSGDSGKLHSKLLTNVLQVLTTCWWFRLIANMFKAMARICEHYAHRLEGCHCHGEIWQHKRKRCSIRLREVSASTGQKGCVWKGRQLSWWIMVGANEFLNKIKSADTHMFDELLGPVPNDRKAEFLQWFEQLQTKLVAIFRKAELSLPYPMESCRHLLVVLGWQS